MFTGIVEEIGSVASTKPGILIIKGDVVLSDLKIGDSVAVDGVCLTAVQIGSQTFTADVQPETLRRSTLGSLTVGHRVNLERAMPANGRFGGHIVQGHVDGTGRLAELRPDGDGLIARFQAPTDLMRYIVTKGFIAINGTSLTVVDVGDDWFTVALINFTREHVAMLDGGVGTPVNLEVDVMAKYLEKLVSGQPIREGVTLEKLQNAGFV